MTSYGNKRERIEVGLYSAICYLLFYLLPGMKKIGITEPTWSPKVALQKQIEREDLVAWAQKPIEPIKYEYKPTKFTLTETARSVFSNGIHYAKLLRL